VPLQLQHFIADERACAYLPEERARLEYRLLVGLLPGHLETLLSHGWRRFGTAVFRPACRACGECVSIRLPVEGFRPSRAQRKAHNRCAGFEVELSPPRVDEERLALYARWHAGREQARGWEASPVSAADYAQQFAFADECAREVLYRDAGKLVGVGICDETSAAFSAVYFFYDPDYARFSLGANHILTLVDLARARGKSYVYLGFRVMGCFSMRYKAAYLPHELLEGRPDLNVAPRWTRVDGPR
jgi:arginine-tRNA-protein transferase